MPGESTVKIFFLSSGAQEEFLFERWRQRKRIKAEQNIHNAYTSRTQVAYEKMMSEMLRFSLMIMMTHSLNLQNKKRKFMYARRRGKIDREKPCNKTHEDKCGPQPHRWHHISENAKTTEKRNEYGSPKFIAFYIFVFLHNHPLYRCHAECMRHVCVLLRVHSLMEFRY